MVLPRLVLIALLSLLILPSNGSAQEAVPDDLSVDDGIYIGKLVVWFELTAPAASDLTAGMSEPAWDDPDWMVRMDGAVAVILAVDRSVQRAEDIGPVIDDVGPIHDLHARIRSLYAAVGEAAHTCDQALTGRDANLANSCVRQVDDSYAALLDYQVELGLFVDFAPDEIDRAPRSPATPASAGRPAPA